jgi:hypothetical protein
MEAVVALLKVFSMYPHIGIGKAKNNIGWNRHLSGFRDISGKETAILVNLYAFSTTAL